MCVDAAAAKGLLLSAIFDDDPVVFIEPTPLYFGGIKEKYPTATCGYRLVRPTSRAKARASP